MTYEVNVKGVITGLRLRLREDARLAEDTARRALAGDTAAQVRLGDYFSRGVLFPKRPATGVRWYAKAHASGDCDGTCSLARALLDGEGMKRNARRAVTLLRGAVEQGSVAALSMLGRCHVEGTGVTRDLTKGTRMLRDAVARGSIGAAETLAYLCSEGTHRRRSWRAAFAYWRIVAADGAPHAIRTVAVYYEHGLGVKRSPRRAFEWMTRAAEGSLDGDAKHLLAWYFDNGVGTKVDEAEALRWYARSVAQSRWAPGDQSFAPSSAFNIALIHRRNGRRAHTTRWMKKAAAMKHPLATRFLATGDERLLAPFGATSIDTARRKR